MPQWWVLQPLAYTFVLRKETHTPVLGTQVPYTEHTIEIGILQWYPYCVGICLKSTHWTKTHLMLTNRKFWEHGSVGNSSPLWSLGILLRTLGINSAWGDSNHVPHFLEKCPHAQTTANSRGGGNIFHPSYWLKLFHCDLFSLLCWLLVRAPDLLEETWFPVPAPRTVSYKLLFYRDIDLSTSYSLKHSGYHFIWSQ